MATRLLVNPDAPEQPALERAARAIASGAVVAYPTDTLYGLAVDPRSAEAIHRLFRLKGRDPKLPIPLIASGTEQVETFAGTLGPVARVLASRCWPGPLTLVVAASPRIIPEIQAGTCTVAIRVPAHAVARGLAKMVGHPITATSANRSAEPAASSADEVDETLGSAVDLILDAGATRGGLPSTIVDVTGDGARLVRAGAVPWARVLEFLR
ncbi:MAG: threonylcarbamoyl-AMP synthase [Acidobacteria bacterium]|nr:threonylcarbamoyl-AMP synthase [Acidobacteriota bacterium]